jgi:putative tricarboxylic transport membrane protein
MSKRTSYLLSGFICAIGASYASTAAAQDYPSRDIQFVVPFSAGGGSDVVARNIVNAITALELLPVGIVVDNRPGGGGSVGYTYLAQREGDPHFVGTVAISFFTTPLLGDSPVNYQDFQPVAAIATDPYVMTVRSQSDLNDFGSLADRDRFVVGSSAAVSDAAILANLVGDALGIQADVVPFDGDGEVLSALLGGHVDVSFSNLSEVLPLIEAGEVRPLAITTEERVNQLPDVPTFTELGHDFVFGNLRGLILPSGVPDEAVDYWEDLMRQIAESDWWRENYLEQFNVLPEFMDREEFGQEMTAINDRYEALMRETGIIE